MHVCARRGGEHSNISAVAADSTGATSPYKIGLFIDAVAENTDVRNLLTAPAPRSHR